MNIKGIQAVIGDFGTIHPSGGSGNMVNHSPELTKIAKMKITNLGKIKKLISEKMMFGQDEK